MSIVQLKDEARARLCRPCPPPRSPSSTRRIIEGMGDFLPDDDLRDGAGLRRALQFGEPRRRGAEGSEERARAADGGRRTRRGEPPRPELAVVIDRARAGDTGLTSAALGMQLRLAMNGQVAGKLREGTTETDIVVRLSRATAPPPRRSRTLDIFTPQGPRAVRDVAAHRDRRRRRRSSSTSTASGG